MLLTPGARVGIYEIVSGIGAGGMGEVYRARDTRLGREVAIKVLPAAFADDPDRLARFRREAQVLASLNHPNIAQVHGLEEHREAGVRADALVMEFVGGEDLAQRLARGALGIQEALEIALQVALALEAAHEQGIVHRDLKPANVKVRPDAAVKVLDFGLAKSVEPSRADGATTFAATALGVVIGTAAYMAPEQATGAAVDRRADIWAFGAVLYELLAGRRAFPGSAASEIIGNVLAREPDWSALPASTPGAVQRLLRRCLVRDPKQRLQWIGDARIELSEVLNGRTDRDFAARAPVRPLRVGVPAVIAGVALGAAGLWSVPWNGGVHGQPAPLTRFSLLAPAGDVVTPARQGSTVAVSPDGRTVVYSAMRDGAGQLFRRSMDQLLPVPLNGTTGGTNPFFSPDGAWVAFEAGGKLRKVRLDGGADPVEICDAPLLSPGSWSSDDTIVFGSTSGIQRVRASGGTPQALTTLEAGDFRHGLPQFLPGERHVLYHVDRGNDDVVAAVAIGDRRVTHITAATGARYSPTGHLVLIRGVDLVAVPFDAATLKITGEETVLADHPQPEVAGGAAHFAFGPGATMVYVPPVPAPVRRAVWAQAGAAADALPIEPRAYSELAFSPVADLVALGTRGEEGMEVSVRDLVRRIAIPIATGRANAGAAPVWSPDGRRLAYSRWEVNRFNLYVRDIETPAPAVQITDRPSAMFAQFWTDAGDLVFAEVALDRAPANADLQIVSASGGQVRPLLETPYAEVHAALSPDGRYMAYQSNESGGWLVYVRPFPQVDSARWAVSPEHGEYPLWSPDGRWLFYRSGGKVVRVAVSTKGKFTSGTPEPVYDGRFPTTGQALLDYIYPHRLYGVARSGRVAVLEEDPVAARVRAPRELVVVTNWVAQLTP